MAEFEDTSEVAVELHIDVPFLVAHRGKLAAQPPVYLFGNVGTGTDPTAMPSLERFNERSGLSTMPRTNPKWLAYEVGIALVDEHARTVEPKAPAVIAAVEVSRRLGRNEQEHVALARPQAHEGNGAQRPMGILELLRVEGVVFGLRHLGERLRPNGNHGVEDMALRVLFEPRFLKPGTLGGSTSRRPVVRR